MADSATATDNTNAGESGATDQNTGGQGAGEGGNNGGEGGQGGASQTASSTGDGNNGGEGAGGEGKGEGEGEGGQGVTYTDLDVSKFPEGFELGDDGAALKALGESKGIPQDVMQEAINLFAEHNSRIQTQALERIANQTTEWEKDVRGDKDLGGDKFDETMKTAAKAIDAFGSPDLKELLNKTGLGSHPEMVRFANAVGKAISEDKLVTGHEPHNEKSKAASLYPSMAQQ